MLFQLYSHLSTLTNFQLIQCKLMIVYLRDGGPVDIMHFGQHYTYDNSYEFSIIYGRSNEVNAAKIVIKSDQATYYYIENVLTSTSMLDASSHTNIVEVNLIY